ncbi:hypothetical protein OH799_32590 [Nocardia sp. NBC_00881]|uniref:hypothetical protein n=1 Tax=Nocardia sp. NBC_00881 TaxID=2975995 RepID=UPI003867B437|nr:hypothetical protein OH799_32590 [Nocardia sp. NBC_00881]
MAEKEGKGAPREEFHLVGQAYRGSVSNTNVELIVDNNVVSIAESVMRKGFVENDIQHRRLRNICDWARSGDAEFNCYVGAVEGAGFDGYSVSSYSLARRLASSAALFRAATTDCGVDPFDATPLQDRMLVKLPDITSAVDHAQDLAGNLFLPNYIAILLWRLVCEDRPNRRDAETSRTLLLELGRRLETKINYLPLTWIMLFYAEFGTFEVARTVRSGLFKLDGSSLAKNSRSGGWDMSLLSYMSMLRSVDQLEGITVPRMPVLVTADAKFAHAAAMVTAVGNTGLFEINFDRLRQCLMWLISRVSYSRSVSRRG